MGTASQLLLVPSTVKGILEQIKRQICCQNFKYAESYLDEVLKQISSGQYECFLMYFVESYLKSTNKLKNILYSLDSYVCRRNVINFTNSTPFSQAFHYCDFHVEVKVSTETQFLNLYFILRLHISYSFLKLILAVSLGKQNKSCACSCLRKKSGMHLSKPGQSYLFV